MLLLQKLKLKIYYNALLVKNMDGFKMMKQQKYVEITIFI